MKIGAVRAGENVDLTVMDNGSGMDEATSARIFQPFFTTKGEKGTGLGLVNVMEFVRQSGGSIDVQSAVGKGTAFTMHLPEQRKEVYRTAAAA